jgi:hypothetical protein
MSQKPWPLPPPAAPFGNERPLRLADQKLAERIAAVDEQPGTRGGRQSDAVQSLLASLRVTTIKGADSDGEHKVVWLFARLQEEIFDRDVANAHAARCDFVGRGGFGLRDGRAGPVDAKDVAGREPGCDRSCRRAGAAPNLEHAGVRLERQRINDRGKAGRQSCRHGRKVPIHSVHA